MEGWVKQVLDEQKKKRKLPLEVKKIGWNYYLYSSTTVWSKEEKRRKKVSRYIGKITEHGVVEGIKNNLSVRSIYEYGNARCLMDIANDVVPSLKDVFPDDYHEIVAMGMVRMMQSTPLRLIKSRWEKLYLSREMKASLSPNVLSEKLRLIGSDWDAQKVFFDRLLQTSKYLLFDLSSLFSYSQDLRLAEKGHNADHLYVKQVNFALFFSHDNGVPVMLKPMPGSIRDVKSLRHMLGEVKLESVIMVLDRGSASYKIPDLLRENGVSFVLPLRRNFQVIDYDMKMNGCFVYHDRGINWGRKRVGQNFLYLFEDVKLRAEEETNFINLIGKGKRKKGQLCEERKRFGKIALLSNLDEAGEQIYLLYKNREEIEVAFDAMKNEMENDKSYLSDDDAVRGYFFISFISLYFYFRILGMLRQHDLVGNVSVQELLFEFSKVYQVYYSDGRKRLSEIPAKVEKLEKTLGLKLFPKEMRS
jgi:transposase